MSSPEASHACRPVVGFDLDMTLVDARPGIIATCAALSAESGVRVDGELAASRLGPPLEVELANWFPPERVAAAADRYRTLYRELALARTTLLPGAAASVAAVRASGGAAVVITAKHEPLARLTLERLGLRVDAVVGDRWGPGKGEALRQLGAAVYVGDHLSDIDGARAAGAVAVAVASGPIPAGALRAHGADVVLDSLLGFPAWWRRARRGA